MATIKKPPRDKETTVKEQVVFVVDQKRVDINCGRLVGERLVKFKHGGRAVAVSLLHCHDTLDAAKAALADHLRCLGEAVERLEYDEKNFWVA